MRKTVDPLSMIRNAANKRTARLSANSTAGINRGETKSILNHFKSDLEVSPWTAVNGSSVVLSLPERPEPQPEKLNAKEPWVGVLIHGSHGPGYRIGLSQRFSAFLSWEIFSRDRGLKTLAAWGAGPLRAFVCKVAKLNTKSPCGEGVKILSGLGAATASGPLKDSPEFLSEIFFGGNEANLIRFDSETGE